MFSPRISNPSWRPNQNIFCTPIDLKLVNAVTHFFLLFAKYLYRYWRNAFVSYFYGQNYGYELVLSKNTIPTTRRLKCLHLGIPNFCKMNCARVDRRDSRNFKTGILRRRYFRIWNTNSRITEKHALQMTLSGNRTKKSSKNALVFLKIFKTASKIEFLIFWRILKKTYKVSEENRWFFVNWIFDEFATKSGICNTFTPNFCWRINVFFILFNCISRLRNSV